jgi:hypothetical protein
MKIFELVSPIVVDITHTMLTLPTEMAISFVGLVRWSLDLFIYLLQEIFNLNFALKQETHAKRPGREKDRDWIHEYSKWHISFNVHNLTLEQSANTTVQLFSFSFQAYPASFSA